MLHLYGADQVHFLHSKDPQASLLSACPHHFQILVDLYGVDAGVAVYFLLEGQPFLAVGPFAELPVARPAEQQLVMVRVFQGAHSGRVLEQKVIASASQAHQHEPPSPQPAHHHPLLLEVLHC